VSRLSAAAALAYLLGAGACAGPLHISALDDVERVRASDAARDGAALAPQVYARAEQERGKALAAHAARDDVGAVLHAERAMAAYEHALLLARASRAESQLADAQKALDDLTAQQQTLDASRTQLEHDAADLDSRVKIARDRLLPAASGATSPEREAARLVAARSLAVEARVLCGAAKLVAADADGLGAAEADVTAAQSRLANAGHPVPFDDAAAARVHCLDVLTRARRAAARGGGADALLAELSASGGWDPVRDERGVVVTLRGTYRGNVLTEEGASKLKELGRVAAAHPSFAVQLVVHDAVATPGADAADGERAQAAARAIESGGEAPARIGKELAGARAPVADPADPEARPRNERLDVVFVGP
jgi:hypothetical protein